MLGFHRNRFLVLASLVPLTALTVAMGRAAPTTPTPASPPAIENKDASWFVAKVKTIVDAGELFYPEQVERTLGLQMQRTDKERIAQPPECSGASAKSSVISSDFTIADAWFRSGPGGVPQMKLPWAFINPASAVGEPAIAYKIFETAYCSGERNVLQRTEAVLSFGNLSGFACL